MYTACLYKSEADFDRGRLYFSETFETYEEALALCETFEINMQGGYTEILEEDEE